MEKSFIVSPGYPHILLGLLRRMPGIEDMGMLRDPERTLEVFKSSYPEDKICNEIMEEACRLGIISEMVSILNEPMWRKRSFINKSAIRIMAEGRIKEYQMCELLESLMQIFEWDFELKVMRRWKTSEKDSVEYNKDHPRYGKGGQEPDGHAGNENSTGVHNGNDVREDKRGAGRRNGPRRNSTEVEKNAGSRGRNRRSGAGNASGRYGRPNGNRDRGRGLKTSGGRRGQDDRSYGRRTAYDGQDDYYEDYGYYDEYDDYDDDYYDENGMITDVKAYIQNEIVKSGIRFESIMTNSVKKDVRSAVRGNAEAQYRMGSYYAEPDTRHTDYSEALKWYRVSASQGNRKAQFELGMLYDSGKVKCPDYKQQAIKCYIGLAESGFPTAQCMLGMKYRLGDGVDEDINEAIKWFKRAALQGHTDAQRNLGDVYAAIGKQDEAVKWYERGAAGGDSYCARMIKKN